MDSRRPTGAIGATRGMSTTTWAMTLWAGTPKGSGARKRTTSIATSPAMPASSTLVPEALVPEALVPEALVPEALVPEALVPEALVPEALVPEALVPAAMAPEAAVLAPSAVSAPRSARTSAARSAAGRKAATRVRQAPTRQAPNRRASSGGNPRPSGPCGLPRPPPAKVAAAAAQAVPASRGDREASGASADRGVAGWWTGPGSRSRAAGGGTGPGRRPWACCWPASAPSSCSALSRWS